MTRFSWDQRIERAAQLAATHAFASELLRFYQEIACFQKDFYGYLESTNGIPTTGSPDTNPLDRLDAASLFPRFASLLALVQRVGPPSLAQAAGSLAGEERTQWQDLITRWWRRDELPAAEENDTKAFFARAFLQPYAEYLAGQTDPSSARDGDTICPFCRHKPQVGVLREESYGAKRSLICSLCSGEWDYRRILCPACGEDRSDQLPVYTTEQFEYVRVEACDSCKTYIKTTDLTKDARAIPVVDELATTPLDLWAHERGYKKLEPNLLGL